MSDIVEFVSYLTVTGWRVLCAVAVLALGLVILDRRDRPRAVRAVRRVEKDRKRRAA